MFGRMILLVVLLMVSRVVVADCPVFVTIDAPDGSMNRTLSFFGRPVFLRWNACLPNAPLLCDDGHEIFVTPFNPVGSPEDGGVLTEITLTPFGKPSKTFSTVIGLVPFELKVGDGLPDEQVKFDHVPEIPPVGNAPVRVLENALTGYGVLRITLQHACR